MSPSTNPCRVLVVDDIDSANLLGKILERRGFVVHRAHSIALAVVVAKEAQPDVLLSDIRLPDGDCCDLLQRLRSERPLHAIAISASNQGAEILRCLQAGFDAFHAKPLSVSEVITTIERLSSRASPCAP